MTTRIEIINGAEHTVVTADEGKILHRIRDGFEVGPEVVLGVDYSTGVPREDKAEYYEEVDEITDSDEILD